MIGATSQQNMHPPSSLTKKRKEVETRSGVWDHFEKIYDNEGKLIKAKCLYCAKLFACESKIHGTYSIRNHN